MYAETGFGKVAKRANAMKRRKIFFFEKKKQKTFVPCGARQSRRAR
jgi:hypothetical protein